MKLASKEEMEQKLQILSEKIEMDKTVLQSYEIVGKISGLSEQALREFDLRTMRLQILEELIKILLKPEPKPVEPEPSPKI